MEYTIVSGNKTSSVALHPNYAIVFIELTVLIKCQIFILNYTCYFNAIDTRRFIIHNMMHFEDTVKVHL